MGGVHTVFRQTKAYNIVRTYSILYLPQKIACRENDSPGINGAFPEFFPRLHYLGYHMPDLYQVIMVFQCLIVPAE